MHPSGYVNETYAKVVDDGGKSTRSNQWYEAHGGKLCDRTVKDREVCVSIQARWVDDAVRLRSVFMKRKRPCPREGSGEKISQHPSARPS